MAVNWQQKGTAVLSLLNIKAGKILLNFFVKKFNAVVIDIEL